MTKSTGKKIKLYTRVMFRHVATGNKPMTGTVIDIKRVNKQTMYTVQDDKRMRYYPGVMVNSPRSDGEIIEVLK